jgi:uncharacterized integral membrane protein
MSARNEAVGMPVENQRNIGDWIKLIVGVIGGAALIIFFLQNRQEVNVNFLWMEWTTGLIWALLASAILGALSAVAFATIRARRRMG